MNEQGVIKSNREKVVRWILFSFQNSMVEDPIREVRTMGVQKEQQRMMRKKENTVKCSRKKMDDCQVCPDDDGQEK